MGASCYFCQTGVTERIPNTDAGDAVGVCKVCSVLACLGHGFRDQNYPRWICVICDVSLLTVAAVQQSRDPATRDGLLQGVSDELKEAAKSVRSSDARPPQRNEASWWWLAESVREWMQSLDSLRDDRWQGIWQSLNPEGQVLLACAFSIVDRLQLPERELIEPLRRLLAWVPARA